MEMFKECLVCSSDQIKEISKYAKHHMVRCSNCKLVFSKSIPSNEELNNFYSNYERIDQISPITIKRYHEWFDNFEKYKKTGNFLDIGCSSGHLPRVAISRGWDSYGTEVDEESVTLCESYGVKMTKGFLSDHKLEKGSFDVITSIEVIEHINNPVEELQLIHDLLRPGGLFFLTTPNFSSIDKIIAGKEWNIVHYPEHLALYSKPSMRQLAKRTNFDILKMETTGMSLKRVMQSRSIKEDKNSISGEVEDHPVKIDQINEADTDERLRQKMESSKLLGFTKKCLNSALKATNKGTQLKVFLVKK